MHRVSRRALRAARARDALRPLWAALLGLCLACGAPPLRPPDPPQIEGLRAQITKARNAIAETRAALGRSRNTPEEPELWIRLAELIGEEARAHYQVAKLREGDAQALHVPQVRVLKTRAIDLYARVIARWPDSPQARRARFNQGQEQRELGDFDAMRATLGALVASAPEDPLAAEALLILGDDHFDRGALDEAAAAYAQITRGPPSRTAGLAFYKLGWVRVNQGDCPRALAAFEQALERGRDAPAEGARIDVRREALVDLVFCYSRQRPPEQAVAYLRARAADRAAFVAALERLGDRYAAMDQALGALDVARALLDHAPDSERRLDDARSLHAALRQTERYTEIGADARRITAATSRRLRQPGLDPTLRDRLSAELEALVRDLATRAQEALLAKGDPVDPAAAAQVAAAYLAHLDAFPEAEARLAVMQNLADVHSAADADFEAGRWYLAVADARSAADPAVSKALYEAVIHFQAALEAEDRGRLERVVARAGLRRAGRRLLDGGGLAAEQARKVKFALARTHYDEGRLREAADALEAIAWEAAGTAEGDAAAELLLDAYRTHDDLLGLIQAGRRLTAAGSPVSPAVQARIGPLVAAAEQAQLDHLALAAAGEAGGDPQAALAAFADRFQGSPLGERALLNAFLAARADGDTARMATLADRLEREYPRSEQLAGVLTALGRAAAARYELDRAVQLYARAAAAGGPDALALAAASLRAELADPAGALGDLGQALKATRGAARQAPATALARWSLRHPPPAEAVQHLQPLATEGGPWLQAALGLALVRAGQLDAGEQRLAQAVEASAADPEARALALYGQAEALAGILRGFQPGPDPEETGELITLTDVTEQAYLKAAREADPAVTPAALGRLATLAEEAATRLAALPAPKSLSPEQAARFKAGLEARQSRLRATAAEALATCAAQAWARFSFGPAARACLAGRAPAADPLRPDPLAPRRPAPASAAPDALRARVAKNPEDGAALQALGEALLAAGDPHVARLALSAAVRAGAGAAALNLLGLAHHAAGDHGGALEAFARAAAGGLEAGRQNLAAGLRALGLSAAAEEALRRWPEGRPGGARLEAGR